jgi:hypothetical protein
MLNESHTLTLLQIFIRRSDCFSAPFDNKKLWPFLFFKKPPRREKIMEKPKGLNTALMFLESHFFFQPKSQGPKYEAAEHGGEERAPRTAS